jgi:hypothetical protein
LERIGYPRPSLQGRDAVKLAIRQRNQSRARAKLARMSNARLILTFVALFAFTVQNYLTQTHIHVPPAIALAGDLGATGEPAKNSPDKYPANQDPANCPICQEIMHAGQPIVPAVVLLALPSVVVFGFPVFIETVTHFRAPSHIWQGRAPPQV